MMFCCCSHFPSVWFIMLHLVFWPLLSTELFSMVVTSIWWPIIAYACFKLFCPIILNLITLSHLSIYFFYTCLMCYLASSVLFDQTWRMHFGRKSLKFGISFSAKVWGSKDKILLDNKEEGKLNRTSWRKLAGLAFQMEKRYWSWGGRMTNLGLQWRKCGLNETVR